MHHLFILAFLGLTDSSLIHLELGSETKGRPPADGVHLVLVDPTTEEEVARRTVPVPWQGEWSAALRSGLQLEVESPDYWSPPFLLDGTESRIALELFPRGEIVFGEASPAALDAAAGQREQISLEVSSVPALRAKDRLGRTRLACRREAQRFHCPAPALALDLRVEKADHVPHYLFNARVQAGKTLDLGRIRFERGASMSGYVTVEEGVPTGTEVAIQVAGHFSPAETQRQELRKIRAAVNERGFFQVVGIPPGGYLVEAKRAGLIETELGPVEVVAGLETALTDPLHLTRAAILELHVAPPLGSLGRTWKMTLIREDPAGGTETFEGEADADGIWRQADLPPGRYQVHVADPDGEKTGAGDDSIWATETLELAPGSQSVFVDIPSIEVEGTLRAGDAAIAARLIFGGFHGAPHVTLRSDEEGRFAGRLPRAGVWDLDAEIGGQLRSLPAVEVEARSGGKAARLDIRLPETRLHGRVTHKGKIVAGASLWGRGRETGTSARFDVDTDQDGTFDIQGLAAGLYAVTASSAELRVASPELDFEIREGAESPPVEIELEELIRIEGQILAGGVPTPNAGIGLFLRARHGDDARPGRSDAAGTVKLLVPASTREIGLVVSAPGFAWQIFALRPALEEPRFRPFVTEVAQNGGTLRLAGEDLRKGRLSSAGSEVPLHLVKDTLRSAGYVQEKGNTWILANASPGIYRICGARSCAEGFLAAGGDLELNLDPEKEVSAQIAQLSN